MFARHDERLDRRPAQRLVERRPHHDVGGPRTGGDEDLLAVDDVLVAVEFGGRGHRGRVGAEARFGDRHRGPDSLPSRSSCSSVATPEIAALPSPWRGTESISATSPQLISITLSTADMLPPLWLASLALRRRGTPRRRRTRSSSPPRCPRTGWPRYPARRDTRVRAGPTCARSAAASRRRPGGPSR